MRRWRIWVFGGLVLVGGFIVLLTSLPTVPLYDFLEGKTRVNVQKPGDIGVPPRPVPEHAYSFKGDFRDFVDRVEGEVTKKGLVRWSERGRGSSSEPDMIVYAPAAWQSTGGPPTGSSEEYKMVRLRKDVEVPSAEPLTVKTVEKKGWITVEILGHEPPSLFENFMGWVGL